MRCPRCKKSELFFIVPSIGTCRDCGYATANGREIFLNPHHPVNWTGVLLNGELGSFVSAQGDLRSPFFFSDREIDEVGQGNIELLVRAEFASYQLESRATQ